MQSLSGSEIHRIRTKEFCLGLEPFAELTDITKPTLIKYEKGRSRPKRWFLEKLEQIRQTPVVIQIRRFTRETKKRWELIKARAGRSQREISQILGIDFTMLSKWENGHPVPEKWITVLCQFYQKSKYVLFPDLYKKETALSMAA